MYFHYTNMTRVLDMTHLIRRYVHFENNIIEDMIYTCRKVYNNF